MKINIDKKYVTNVLSKYDYTNKDEYEKAYSKKERSMWFFALLMLKKDVDVDVYDSDNPKDVAWLQRNLNIAVHIEGVEKFTLKEWFEFLSTQPDE